MEMRFEMDILVEKILWGADAHLEFNESVDGSGYDIAGSRYGCGVGSGIGYGQGKCVGDGRGDAYCGGGDGRGSGSGQGDTRNSGHGYGNGCGYTSCARVYQKEVVKWTSP